MHVCLLVCVRVALDYFNLNDLRYLNDVNVLIHQSSPIPNLDADCKVFRILV